MLLEFGCLYLMLRTFVRAGAAAWTCFEFCCEQPVGLSTVLFKCFGSCHRNVFELLYLRINLPRPGNYSAADLGESVSIDP